MDTLIITLSILFYAASLFLLLNKMLSSYKAAKAFNITSVIALLLHSAAVYQITLDNGQFSLGLTSALVVTSCTVSILSFFIHLKDRFKALVAIAWAWSIVTLGLYFVLPPLHAAGHTNYLLATHIILSIGAYTVIAVATLEALFTLILDQMLKRRKGIVFFSHFPPLQSLESHFFLMLYFGQFLLTISLISGFVAVEDFFAQHLVHKSVLSLVSWGIFSVLILGRTFAKWRGPVVLKWSLVAFTLTFIGYFGSKFVLQIVLG